MNSITIDVPVGSLNDTSMPSREGFGGLLRSIREKLTNWSNDSLDKYKEQSEATKRVINVVGIVALCLLASIILFGGFGISVFGGSGTGIGKYACRSVDLETLIDGPFLFGKVDQPQITIYTYLLHDMEAKPTSLEIYQNGKPHEKFLNGEWWKYDTTRAAATANGIAIVGLLDNGCLTEPKIFNLPLQVQCKLLISSHLVNTPDGVELQIQAQSVRKVEYYLFVPDPHHTNLIPAATDVFVDENRIGETQSGELFKILLKKYDFSTPYMLYVGANKYDCHSIIDVLLSTSVQSTETTSSASSGVPITSLDSHADKTGIDTIAPLLVKQKKDADIRDKEIYSERVTTLKQNQREVTQVNANDNPGGFIAKNSEGDCDPWFSSVKIRSIYDQMPGLVIVKILVVGGPVDVYYLVRPENTSIGDPSITAVMQYGQKAGNFNDEKVELVIKDFVPSVYNVLYVVSVSGKCGYGVFKRRFIA